MKKIVRLTESDLVRLVKKIVKESELDRELPMRKKGYLGHNDRWYDEMDSPVKGEFDYDEEIEFGPDDFEDYISQTDTDFPENKWSFGAKGFKGDRSPGKGYWDRYQKDGPIRLRKKRMDEQNTDERKKWHTFGELKKALLPKGFIQDTQMEKDLGGNILILSKGNDNDGIFIMCKPSIGEWTWSVTKGGRAIVDKKYQINLKNYDSIGVEGQKVHNAIMKDITPYLNMKFRPLPNKG